MISDSSESVEPEGTRYPSLLLRNLENMLADSQAKPDQEVTRHAPNAIKQYTLGLVQRYSTYSPGPGPVPRRARPGVSYALTAIFAFDIRCYISTVLMNFRNSAEHA